MLLSLKNARRRVVERALEAAGASEKTVDEDYDNQLASFYERVDGINEFISDLSEVIIAQQRYFMKSADASISLQKVLCADSVGLRSTASHYEAKLKILKDTHMAKVESICTEDGVEILKKAIAVFVPDVDEADKSRQVLLQDFDSYRRRVKDAEIKRDAVLAKVQDAAQEKSLEKNAAALKELQYKVDRCEEKLQAAKISYDTFNECQKAELAKKVQSCDQLIEDVFVTLVAAEAELMVKSSAVLSEIADALPQEKVSRVRSQLRRNVDWDAIETVKPFPPITASQNISSSEAAEATQHVPATGGSEDSAASSFYAKTKDGRSSTIIRQPGDSALAKKVVVVALFDHVAEDEDELSFYRGDEIEVLAVSDSGWWRGCLDKDVAGCVAKDGLFSVNYVEIVAE